MDRLLKRAAAALAIVALSASVARAADTGSIEGRVTDGANGKPLAGVTVVATGPQGDQTEFTDSNGRYLITDLAPGEYIVRFYFANVKVERPGIIVQADKSLSVGAAMPTGSVKEMKVVIKERAPTVDVATAQVQTQVTDELVKNAPVAAGSRDYKSALTLAPGSTTDGAGVSFNGATGPENSFLIDGLNTTNPSLGLLGTPLTLEFIKETEIITGGYNAEYGRATGGIVNVITKSGSNEFHGGAWFFYTPQSLDPPRIARPGESVARVQHDISQILDFGVDIGGPIVKDRLWFYAGFAPTFTRATFDRILRARSANNFDPKANTGDTYLGDLDTSITCPPWLKAQSEALCAPTTAAAYRTDDIDPRLWKHYESNKRLYSAIGKLGLRVNDNNNLTVTYISSTQTFDAISGSRFNGNPYLGVFDSSQPAQTHDVVAHFTSKVLDRKLQLDFRAGWHYEKAETIPSDIGAASGLNTDTRTQSLYVFEDELEPCKVQKLGDKSTVNFNPCPVTSYRDSGFGFMSKTINQRAVAMASGTYFLKLLGTHAIKLGGDFEYNHLESYRAFTGGSGGGSFTTFDSGGAFVERSQYGAVDPTDPTGQSVLLYDGLNGHPLGFTASTSTINESVYLRDSWNFGFLPGFTLNLGLRWEGQQVNDVNGHTQIGIFDNIAPRVGFAWDFLGKGQSKLYASYGRFYESIPLDINDRQFSGEGTVIQDLAPTDKGACKTDANGRVDLTTCKFPTPTRDNLNGGTFGVVSPQLQGQYSNEVVVGLQYAPVLDVVLGAAYIHRDIGRIIEDISPDGGRTYIIANPGVAPDASTVGRLQGQIDNLAKQIQGTSDPVKQGDLRKQLNDTSQQLSLYNAAAGFEKPKRDYNALVLTASKRLSYNFIVLASYTYSRTIGNYPGLYQASTGQLDPNISSQYDLPELLVNRNGPLPSDRPHNFKFTGAYHVKMGAAGGLTFGLNFSAVSGTPIEVLGRHPTYGANETFILPRGSGGRTPVVTQLDLRIAYAKEFAKRYRAEISLDVFNVLNQQEVTAVDQGYTTDRVMPIENGQYSDLKSLKTTSGTVPHLNPNYGQPTAFQAPLSMRMGARFSF